MTTDTQGEQVFHQGSGMTLEQVKGFFEGYVQRAVEKAMTQPVAEEAEPEGWWNLWALGPWQPIMPGGPLRPHKIIKVGEPAYIFTVLWLNPFLTLDTGPTVCDLVSNLACDFEVKYCTGNKCTWNLGPPGLNVTHEVKMQGNRCWYYDVLSFVPREDWEGCYQTHICARITGCHPEQAPPLAGFATQVYDYDWELFAPIPRQPGWEVDTPIQFMIYP
jgi:hypothetical protein